MENLAHIWKIIVQSNTFNFVVMLCILCWLVKKFDIKSALETSKLNIQANIEKSKTEKLDGQEVLKTAQASVANLDNEISAQLKDAEAQGENIAQNVLQAAEEKAQQYKDNVKNIIEAEEKKISTTITNTASQKAFMKAKEDIITKLTANPELHEKYINDSLEQLDRIEL